MAQHLGSGQQEDLRHATLPPIQIFTLGRFEVAIHQHPLPDAAWTRRKARQLLKCLISRPRRRASRDLILDWLWPDQHVDPSASTLRSTLHALRSTLTAAGVERATDLVVIDHDGVSLSAGAEVWIDADEVERLHALAESAADPLPALERANRLCAGDYLPDDLYEEWSVERRERLRRLWIDLQFKLSHHRELKGDGEGARAALQRVIDVDPCHEQAAQALITLQMRGGLRAAAGRTYQRLARALRDELGIEPPQAIADLLRDPERPEVTYRRGNPASWTYVLTDIQGSVRHWERDANSMQQALDRHDALIDAHVTGHGGTVITQHGEGDSRFAVFGHPVDAVAAACDLQRAFQRERWPAETPLSIRIAVHSGEAIERNGHFYGSAVNRCARLRSLAYGNQILVSKTTADLVEDALPEQTELRLLGAHALRGFERPELIYQIIHPALQADFPPLVESAWQSHLLPAQTTSLVGRDEDVERICRLLGRDALRLLTLTGVGGVGKTRVGLQVAETLLRSFADGVVFVALAPIRDPDLVISTIAQAVGLRETGGRPVREMLQTYLKERQILLVLDNFEHLLPAAMDVSLLLEACPRLKVLVTSRSALRLRGEHEVAVLPLPYPDRNNPAAVTATLQYPAVALFVQRAETVTESICATAEDALAVTEICRRVDGLPLAIELAAARVRVLTPQALLARMERRLPFLRGGATDLPARHRTLQDTIAWSYDLLPESEQRLFRRLAIFEGGLSYHAAVTVCDTTGDLGITVLDGLDSLVSKSLLSSMPDSFSVDMRYTMLETLREFGIEKLETLGEAHVVRDEHLKYFLTLAEEAEPHLVDAGRGPWLDRLEADLGNLRAAIAWSQTSERNATRGLRLASALGWFWYYRGYLVEGRLNCEQLQERASGASIEAIRAKALWVAGGLASVQGDLPGAHTLLERSVSLYRAGGDERGLGYPLSFLGLTLAWEGDLTAIGPATESVAVFKRTHDSWGLALALDNLGFILQHCHDLVEARRLHEESAEIYRRLGDRWGLSLPLRHLGHIALEEANVSLAAELFQDALRALQGLRENFLAPLCLTGLAWATCLEGRHLRATTLLAAASRLLEDIGARHYPKDQANYERSLAALTAALTEEAFAAAWAEGQSLSVEQAIAYALAS